VSLFERRPDCLLCTLSTLRILIQYYLLLRLSTLTGLTGPVVDLPRIVTILIVAVMGMLLTNVGARPNILHLLQLCYHY
jgi:uncharacterized integral membrane protein